MSEQNGYGMVYYIDMERIKRAREKVLRLDKARVDEQIRQAEEHLDAVKAAQLTLDRLQEVLARMREIAVEAATKPGADLEKLSLEIEEHKKEINAIAAHAGDNGLALLDGGVEYLNRIIDDINSSINPQEGH